MSHTDADVDNTGVNATACVCIRQERRIKELEESLYKCQNVQEQVKGESLMFIVYRSILRHF